MHTLMDEKMGFAQICPMQICRNEYVNNEAE